MFNQFVLFDNIINYLLIKMFSGMFGGGGGRGGDPMGGMGMGPAAANNIFIRGFKVYSPAFIGKPEVNRGNKIILPTSALTELARLKI